MNAVIPASKPRLCPRCRSSTHSATCPRDDQPTTIDRTDEQLGALKLTVLLDVAVNRALWRATDMASREDVVVELFDVAPLVTTRDLERSERIHLGLDHPNVARLIGHGRDASSLYVVYAYPHELRTLATLRAGTDAMSWREALDLVRQLADGLRAIHEAGLRHGAIGLATTAATPFADGSTQAVLLETGLHETARSAEADPRRDLQALAELFLALTRTSSIDAFPDEVPISLQDALRRSFRDRAGAFESARAMSDALAAVPTPRTRTANRVGRSTSPWSRGSAQAVAAAATPRERPRRRLLWAPVALLVSSGVALATWLATREPEAPALARVEAAPTPASTPVATPAAPEPAAPTPVAPAAAPVHLPAPVVLVPVPAPTPAPATHGKLSVSAQVEATVTIDNVARGRTPLTLELPAGLHTLALSAEGHASRELAVDVIAGRDASWNLELDALPEPTSRRLRPRAPPPTKPPVEVAAPVVTAPTVRLIQPTTQPTVKLIGHEPDSHP